MNDETLIFQKHKNNKNYEGFSYRRQSFSERNLQGALLLGKEILR